MYRVCWDTRTVTVSVVAIISNVIALHNSRGNPTSLIFFTEVLSGNLLHLKLEVFSSKKFLAFQFHWVILALKQVNSILVLQWLSS